LQASSGGNRQLTGLSSEDKSEGSESEMEGKDIEGAEFESAVESSDEETSQDRTMIVDATQEEENLVIAHGQYAAMESDSESLSELLVRRFKRRAPDGATDPLRTRRRSRVVFSSPEPSPEAGSLPRCQSHAADDKVREAAGADQLMHDAGAGSSPSESEDDGYGWFKDDFDLGLEDEFSMEDEFARCVIVPRARSWAGSRVSTPSFLGCIPVCLEMSMVGGKNWPQRGLRLGSMSVAVEAITAVLWAAAVGISSRSRFRKCTCANILMLLCALIYI
jgi:hypothetical protein